MKMGKRGAAASLLMVAMSASMPAMSHQPAAAATKEKPALNASSEKSTRDNVSYAIGMDVA
ncbi:FKBP-type peptidyl-prolyl cis-trans isomerase, partial [Xanthomonas oryzae pv. oryzae]